MVLGTPARSITPGFFPARPNCGPGRRLLSTARCGRRSDTCTTDRTLASRLETAHTAGTLRVIHRLWPLTALRRHHIGASATLSADRAPCRAVTAADDPRFRSEQYHYHLRPQRAVESRRRPGRSSDALEENRGDAASWRTPAPWSSARRQPAWPRVGKAADAHVGSVLAEHVRPPRVRRCRRRRSCHCRPAGRAAICRSRVGSRRLAAGASC